MAPEGCTVNVLVTPQVSDTTGAWSVPGGCGRIRAVESSTYGRAVGRIGSRAMRSRNGSSPAVACVLATLPRCISLLHKFARSPLEWSFFFNHALAWLPRGWSSDSATLASVYVALGTDLGTESRTGASRHGLIQSRPWASLDSLPMPIVLLKHAVSESINRVVKSMHRFTPSACGHLPHRST